MPYIHQTNGVTDACCLAPPTPNDGTWFEVSDTDPRAAVFEPPVNTPTLAQQILNDPAELLKLKTALGLV